VEDQCSSRDLIKNELNLLPGYFCLFSTFLRTEADGLVLFVGDTVNIEPSTTRRVRRSS